MNSDIENCKLNRQDMLEAALQVVDHVDAMLAYWDRNGICRFSNNAYKDWFGKSREEIIGKHIGQLLGPVLYEKNLPYINEALNGNIQVFEREIPLPCGDIRHSIATYTPHIVEGKVHGFVAHVADSTLLKNLEKELIAEKEKAVELATHDFLTGLPNRVLLMDKMKNAIANAERNNIFSVMSMDLDKFKKVNDTFGHDVGDILLKEIAKRLNEALRDTDTISRTGGDEFILISSGLKSKNDVESLALRILDSVRKPFECIENNFIEPTLSIGIAIYPMHGKSIDELIKNSDNALYDAKSLGKNRFEFA